MLSGAHAPNGPIQQADIDMVRRTAARAVKLMASDHTPQDVARFPGLQVVLRLPDSRHPDGTYFDAGEYGVKCASLASQFAPAGCTLFQWDNEPNDATAWRQMQYGAYPYQEWCRQALRVFRQRAPQGVKVISPPLSWSPKYWRPLPGEGDNFVGTSLDAWRAAFLFTDGGKRPALWSLFDYAGANVYWQSPQQLNDPSYGCSYQTVHRESGLPVYVTEYGCSAHEPPLMLPPDQVEAIRIRQYPQFLSGLEMDGYVEAAFVFIVGGTDTWISYRLSPALATAIADPKRRKARPMGPWAV